MAARWRLSPALVRLLAQVNASARDRSRASDGTIGDAEHSSRASAHNPDAHGVVRALDLTHDPRGGMDAHALADRLLAHQDPRLRLVISRGRIGSGPAGPSPGTWRKYSGRNPHDKHVHVEVVGPPVGDRDGAWVGVVPAHVQQPASRSREDEDMTPAQAAQLQQAAADVAHLKAEMDGVRRDLRELGAALNLQVRDRTKLDGEVES